jgi:hypothetical protein
MRQIEQPKVLPHPTPRATVPVPKDQSDDPPPAFPSLG